MPWWDLREAFGVPRAKYHRLHLFSHRLRRGCQKCLQSTSRSHTMRSCQLQRKVSVNAKSCKDCLLPTILGRTSAPILVPGESFHIINPVSFPFRVFSEKLIDHNSFKIPSALVAKLSLRHKPLTFICRHPCHCDKMCKLMK